MRCHQVDHGRHTEGGAQRRISTAGYQSVRKADDQYRSLFTMPGLNQRETGILTVGHRPLCVCHTIIGPPQKRSPRTVHGRIIGPPWDHPWRCKQSPLAVIGPTSCSLAQVTNIHWRVNYEARKRKQTRMESLHRPSGGHVVQVILSGAHNAPERIYKSRHG